MYKIVLYGECSTTGDGTEVIIKTEKDPKRDSEGILIFSDDKGKTVAEFNRGAWQYWEDVDEEA